MSATGTPTVVYPPDLVRHCTVLKEAYTLCRSHGYLELAGSLMTFLHEIEDGY
jgi:hypothetical protein